MSSPTPAVAAENASFERGRAPGVPARESGWVTSLMRVPLVGKIAGANAIIVIVTLLVAIGVEFDGPASTKMALMLAVPLGLGLLANAALVLIALRPLKDLEGTAQRIWHGELEARVPSSSVADAGIQRVGNTLNVLLDGLNADRIRLRTLANQVIQAGDRERAALARELHDSTAQTLAALLLELSVLASENKDQRLDERLGRVRAIVTDVLDEVRLLAHTVHPRVLDDLGLVAALQLLARESNERSTVDVMYEGPAKAESVDAMVSSALYRVAQEAVGNALRHSHATSVTLRFTLEGDTARLAIADDGAGFIAAEVEQRRPGMGLFTMRERAALVGGKLEIETGAGRGTRVVATVPVTAAPPAAGAGVPAATTRN